MGKEDQLLHSSSPQQWYHIKQATSQLQINTQILANIGNSSNKCFYIVVVQSPRRVQLFTTPWNAAHQTLLSFTISQSLLKLMSIEQVMPSNQHLLSSPSLSAFNLCQHRCLFLLSQFFASGGQSIGVSLQHQFFQGIFRTSLLGLTVLISLQSKGL